MAKSKTFTALAYLQSPDAYPPTAFCVAHGGDAFLKRETLTQIRHSLLGDDGEELMSLTVLRGSDVEPRDVFDALRTISLFGADTRLVIIEGADDFLSNHRPLLEDYAERPAQDAVLVLDVSKWPGNTRIAKKLVKEKALVVDCSSPDPDGRMNATTRRTVRVWLVKWASDRHRLRLADSVADVMLEIVSLSPGLLDQELAKLVGLVGVDAEVSAKLVQENVGNWRTRTAWEMIDATASGNAAEAISQLDRLLSAGEAPQAIFPMLASTLRRFATAGRLITDAEKAGRRVSIQAALKEAGVMPFKIRDAETQLRQLGRDRTGELRQWLLDADLALKGSHSSGDRPRMVLEQLIGRLSNQSRPRRG